MEVLRVVVDVEAAEVRAENSSQYLLSVGQRQVPAGFLVKKN